MQTKNAIDYIKESSFYVNERYQLLRELIDLTLNDKPTDDYILKLVNEVLQIDEEEVVDDLEQTSEPQENLEVEGFTNVKKINSINLLSNIGLLEIDKPIKFKDGLNVFYGKTGSGKSSVYLGLCKALGHDKTVFSNINIEQSNSSCEISVVNDKDEELTIKWETGYECANTNVQIFDSKISNFIVENAQLNQFELAYLKTEYFVFLHSLFDKITNLLQTKLTTAEQNKNSLEKIIVNNAPIYWESEDGYSKETINKIEFTEDENKKLSKYESDINSLKTADLEAIIKNIDNANEQVKPVLNSIGKFKKISDEDNEEEMAWRFIYDLEYFVELNKKIELFKTAKNAYEESGTKKLSSLIPLQWITNERWTSFIDKSIEFLNTLEENEQKKYTSENCPYCQQPLQTDEAKELLKIYHQIRDEHKEKLEQLENELAGLAIEFNEVEIILKSVNNKLIEGEFKHIGITESIEKIDSENIFEKIHTSLTTNTQIEDTKLVSNKIKEYWEVYLPIYEKFLSKTTDFSESLSKKNEKIDELDEKAKPLRNKKAIFENKETIVNYITSNDISKRIKDRLSDLTEIKRATSTLETQFSREIPLQVFKEHLEKEYDHFNFSPPEVWNIAAITHHGENRRFYNLGDKSLSDIFSEGERKIHALADFFAQIELNKFEGVFIFDDPVNSLDEERIECVRDRIIQLVNEGKQVIVFTHNLVFLNTLVDTSDEKVNLIKKLTDQIIIETDLKLGTEAELSRLTKEINRRINDLADQNEDEIDTFELRNIYDLMSGYLESFVELRVFGNIINRYRPNIRMNSLDKMKDFEAEKLDELINLYKQTSRKGSRHSQPVGAQPPKYSELKEHFEILKTNFNYN